MLTKSNNALPTGNNILISFNAAFAIDKKISIPVFITLNKLLNTFCILEAVFSLIFKLAVNSLNLSVALTTVSTPFGGNISPKAFLIGAII